MHRRWKGAAAALLTAFALTLPALGAEIVADGTALTPDQAWIQDGTTYMTLRASAALTGHELTWEDGTARLTGDCEAWNRRISSAMVGIRRRDSGFSASAFRNALISSYFRDMDHLPF